MKLQRCQFEDAITGNDFRVDTSGACGPGIYAMMFGDKKLQKYYSERGEYTFSFDVPDHLVKKIGGKGITTYQAIKESIQMHKENGIYKVFICKHVGINIPKSKQVVITDASIISNIKKI